MSVGRSHFRRTGAVNWRLPLLLAVVAAPFIYFAYVAIDQAAFGGIHQEKDLAVVDLKSLGYFGFNGQYGVLSDVPARWRDLDGKRVALEGSMYDPYSATRTRNFQFVYSITKCCFNGPPLVQERVFAHVPEGSIPFYGDECRLFGKLAVAVHNPTGNLVDSIYTIEVERVEPLKSSSGIVFAAAGIVVAAGLGMPAITAKTRTSAS